METERANSSTTCKRFERNPDFDRSVGCTVFRDAGIPLEFWRVLLSTPGRRQPASQQPYPRIAQQVRIDYTNDRVFSRLKDQRLTTNHSFRTFLFDAGQVVDFAVASAGRCAVELCAASKRGMGQPKRALLLRDVLRSLPLRVIGSHRANQQHFLAGAKFGVRSICHGANGNQDRRLHQSFASVSSPRGKRSCQIVPADRGSVAAPIVRSSPLRANPPRPGQLPLPPSQYPP
jgi:hypothetical protein